MTDHPAGDQRCVCPICGEVVSPGTGEEPLGPCSHCGHLVWFRTQQFGHTIVINLLPSFHLETSDIRRVGELLLRQHPTARILVNLSLVRLIGSTFLDRMVLLKRSVHACSGSLVLCGMNDVVREIFEITRLDGYFEIRE